MLLDSKHLSCFEHQLTPMYKAYDLWETTDWEAGITHITKDDKLYSANMKGWLQYRKVLNNV